MPVYNRDPESVHFMINCCSVSTHVRFSKDEGLTYPPREKRGAAPSPSLERERPGLPFTSPVPFQIQTCPAEHDTSEQLAPAGDHPREGHGRTGQAQDFDSNSRWVPSPTVTQASGHPPGRAAVGEQCSAERGRGSSQWVCHRAPTARPEPASQTCPESTRSS